jgi:hypothetical protein
VGLLEAIVGGLLAAQVLDGGRGEGGGRCCLVGAVTIGGEVCLPLVAPATAVAGQSAQRSQGGELLGGPGGGGLQVGLSVPGSGQFLLGPGDSGSTVGRLTGERGLMGLDASAQLAVDHEGVAGGGKSDIGLTVEGGGHLFGGAAPIGEHAAVVDRGDGGGVPGMGGLTGAGLSAVAPQGIQG